MIPVDQVRAWWIVDGIGHVILYASGRIRHPDGTITGSRTYTALCQWMIDLDERFTGGRVSRRIPDQVCPDCLDELDDPGDYLAEYLGYGDRFGEAI